MYSKREKQIGGLIVVLGVVALLAGCQEQATPTTDDESLKQFDQEVRAHLNAAHQIADEYNTLLDSVELASQHPCNQANMSRYLRFLKTEPQLEASIDKENAWFQSHASDPQSAKVRNIDPNLSNDLQKSGEEWTAISKRSAPFKARFQHAVGTCRE